MGAYNSSYTGPMQPLGMVNVPIDQINTELIYGMIQCPKWYPINYVVGGFYDRCLENFRQFKDQDTITDNDKYDWIRIPTSSRLHTIWLAKPGKVVERRLKTFINDNGMQVQKDVWNNVVRMDLFLYRSMNERRIQGFTFGDRVNVLKPLKLLEHQWERKVIDSWNTNLINSNDIEWICKKCNLVGRSAKNNKAALVPDKILTCDEMMISDIIL